MHFSIIFYVMNALDRLKSKKCESLPKKIATNVIFRLTSYVLTLIWNIQVAVFVYQCTFSLQRAGIILLTRSTVQYSTVRSTVRGFKALNCCPRSSYQGSPVFAAGSRWYTRPLDCLSQSIRIGSRELKLLHRKFV